MTGLPFLHNGPLRRPPRYLQLHARAPPRLAHNMLLGLDAAQMIKRLNHERVARMGYMNVRCHHDPGCPDWIHMDRPGGTLTSSTDPRRYTGAAISRRRYTLARPYHLVYQVFAAPSSRLASSAYAKCRLSASSTTGSGCPPQAWKTNSAGASSNTPGTAFSPATKYTAQPLTHVTATATESVSEPR
jgi:hypothetical protein